jgi:predicted Rossmann fold nucleotide-binding protein DprA/Smf involved in DNA uptake
MKYGVTGVSRELSADERRVIHNAIKALGMGYDDVFVSGGAFGVDTYAAIVALDVAPEATHHLCLPNGNVFNTSLEALWASMNAKNLIIEKADKPGYMARNDLLVKRIGAAGMLLAFPERAAEARRSGTWSTVRRARKLGTQVVILPLDDALE